MACPLFRNRTFPIDSKITCPEDYLKIYDIKEVYSSAKRTSCVFVSDYPASEIDANSHQDTVCQNKWMNKKTIIIYAAIVPIDDNFGAPQAGTLNLHCKLCNKLYDYLDGVQTICNVP